jgi:hypothetical protein
MGKFVTDRVVFLDNTVLTNFGSVERPDLIFLLWPGMAYTTQAVMEEYRAGVQISGLSGKAWERLPIYELTDEDNARIAALPPQFGSGERACLAAAIRLMGVFASDDQQARKYALQAGIVVIGSVGILVRCVQKGLISETDAQALLDRMIDTGYHSPITNLDEILG